MFVGVRQIGQPRPWLCTSLAHDLQKRWWPHGTSAKRVSCGCTRHFAEDNSYLNWFGRWLGLRLLSSLIPESIYSSYGFPYFVYSCNFHSCIFHTRIFSAHIATLFYISLSLRDTRDDRRGERDVNVTRGELVGISIHELHTLEAVAEPGICEKMMGKLKKQWLLAWKTANGESFLHKGAASPLNSLPH